MSERRSQRIDQPAEVFRLARHGIAGVLSTRR